MFQIEFYETEQGIQPAKDFLLSLDTKNPANIRPPGFALVFPSFYMECCASNRCFYIASLSLREYSMFDTTVLGQKNGLSDFSHRPLSESVYVYFQYYGHFTVTLIFFDTPLTAYTYTVHLPLPTAVILPFLLTFATFLLLDA